MRKKRDPLVVEGGNGERGLVYYSNSDLLRQLAYFPYALLAILTALGVLA